MSSEPSVNDFEINDKLYWPSLPFGFYEVYEKKTGFLYSARIKTKSEDKIHERFKLLQLIEHPSICKYITQGMIYCLEDFHAIILEYLKLPLSEIINPEKSILDSTQKLIIIYGIASGMSFLHSNGILHSNLTPHNVFVNHCLIPKITGIYEFEPENEQTFEEKFHVTGTPAYLAPEIYLGKGRSSASDVYSFSLLVYEIMMNEKVYQEMDDVIQIRNEVALKGERPKFNSKISDAYRSLIEKCWSQNPQERLTFDNILNELETNPQYITEDVNEGKFRSYVKFIQQSKKSFDKLHFTSNKMHIYDDFSDYYHLKEINKRLCLPYFVCFIDHNNFEKNKQLIAKSRIYKICSVVDKSTQKKYAAKIISEKWKKVKKSFFKELNTLLKVSHPCLAKFVGISFKTNDPNKFKPEIILDFYSKNTLRDLIELQRKEEEKEYLSDTNKLIIIYGIASGMKYLHSLYFLHRNLIPEKVFLDDYLLPKIGGLGSTYTEHSAESSDLENNKEFKYKYKAPELFEDPTMYNRTMPIDVYSFSIILYEILTNNDPYPDDEPTKIMNDVISGKRPKIMKSIPDFYQKLINSCWSQDPKDRPTFSEIVDDIEANFESITPDINKEEFEKYIEYVKDPEDNPFISESIISIERKQKNLFVNVKLVDLNQYEKRAEIGSGSFGKVYKVLNKQTGDLQACKISILPIDSCSDEQIKGMERELKIISKLNFPSILKFIGFSQSDFKNQPKPTFVTELVTNGSLDVILNLERRSLAGNDWNDTKKLIIIYGIASGMAYLHSLDIVHRDLKPENIFVDDYLFPKIGDFGLSKKIFEEFDEEEDDEKVKKDELQKNYTVQNVEKREKEEKERKEKKKEKMMLRSGQKGTIPFMSPEIIGECKYTKAGDVYAFGVIVYQIITNEELFKGWFGQQIMLNVMIGYRPKITPDVPECYKKLIEKCWKQNFRERPTFEEIVEILKNDTDFITDTIEQDEYYNYVDYIDDLMENENQEVKNSFQKVSISLSKAEEEESNDEENNNFLDLSIYEKLDVISQSDTWKLYQVKNKHNGLVYSAKVTKIKLTKLSRRELINISREINNISQIKHPSILKFIGYSPVDFMKKRRPVIVTELALNGTLSGILAKERSENEVKNWDLTTKLIVMYGIAEGMSYLHSHDIIYRNLTPENIFLNDKFHPKIGNFGLSIHSHTLQSMTFQSTVGLKGTPVYTAPEVLQTNEYSKKSDVYSYGLILYEMMTTEIPFEEINSFADMYRKIITNSVRPEFNVEVPDCYRKLIEWCWLPNPDDRPTFDEIVNILKIESEFRTEQVDTDQFFNYVRYIENADIEFYSDKKIFNHDNLIKKKGKIKETNSDESSESEEEEDEIDIQIDTLNDNTVNQTEKLKSKIENKEKSSIENKEKDSTTNDTKIDETKELTYMNEGNEKGSTINCTKIKEVEELVDVIEDKEKDSIKNETKIKEAEELPKIMENKEKESAINDRKIDETEKSSYMDENKEEELDVIEEHIQLNCKIQTINNKNESSSKIAKLAKKYSRENDAESTYKYMNMCISSGQSIVVLEYAISLYRSNHFKQALDYFVLLSKINHPIAKYYIGVMKFFGQGCDKNISESFQMMKYLSSNGIDKATEFIENYFDENSDGIKSKKIQ